jgi:hypothetical protein
MSNTPMSSDNQSAFMQMKKHWEAKAGKTLLNGGIEKHDIEKIMEIVRKQQKKRHLPALIQKIDDFRSRVNNRIAKLQQQADKTKKPVDPQQLHHLKSLIGACDSLAVTVPDFFEKNNTPQCQQKTLKAIKDLESIYKDVKNRKFKKIEAELQQFYTNSLGIDFKKLGEEAEQRKNKSKAFSVIEKNRLDDFLKNIHAFAESTLVKKEDYTAFVAALNNLTPALHAIISINPGKSFWNNKKNIASFFEFICADNISLQIKDETKRIMETGITRSPDALKALMIQKGLAPATETPTLRRFVDALFQGKSGSEIKKTLLAAAQNTSVNSETASKKPLHIDISDDIDSIDIAPFTPSASSYRSRFFDSNSKPSIAETTVKDSQSSSLSQPVAEAPVSQTTMPLPLATDLLKQLKILASKIVRDLDKSVSFSPTSRKTDIEKILTIGALIKSITENNKDLAGLKAAIVAAKQKNLSAAMVQILKQFEKKIDKELQISPTMARSGIRL